MAMTFVEGLRATSPILLEKLCDLCMPPFYQTMFSPMHSRSGCKKDIEHVECPITIANGTTKAKLLSSFLVARLSKLNFI